MISKVLLVLGMPTLTAIASFQPRQSALSLLYCSAKDLMHSSGPRPLHARAAI